MVWSLRLWKIERRGGPDPTPLPLKYPPQPTSGLSFTDVKPPTARPSPNTLTGNFRPAEGGPGLPPLAPGGGVPAIQNPGGGGFTGNPLPSDTSNARVPGMYAYHVPGEAKRLIGSQK